MLMRWSIYLWEMFNPVSRLFFSLLSCAAVLFTAQIANGETALIIGGSLILGTVSYFLIMLYYRLCDEFKDYETDVKYFPRRPLPSGRVTFRDLNVLIFVISTVLFVINITWRFALIEFLTLYVFAYFMGKWFFMEPVIANNRLLAFLTHAPVAYFGGFYLLGLYASPRELSLWSAEHWLIVSWLAIPGFVWEVARKTRAPEEEEENYQTYSAMLGYRLSATIASLLVAAEFTCFWALSEILRLSPWALWVMVLATLSQLVLFVLFINTPRRYSSYLRTAAELYGGVCIATVVIDLLITRGVAWAL